MDVLYFLKSRTRSRLIHPTPLKELRPGRAMVIPQSYRFLSEAEITSLAPYLNA